MGIKVTLIRYKLKLAFAFKGCALVFGNKTKKFEVMVLKHLDAAYHLARWLMGNDADAQDAVQIASLRALTYLDSLRGDDAKAWFLGIVRNVCMNGLAERSSQYGNLDITEIVHQENELEILGAGGPIPEQELIRSNNRVRVNQALKQLPVVFREVLILREMEEMPYERIAMVTEVPVGTVMSRLARARQQFRKAFMALNEEETV